MGANQAVRTRQNILSLLLRSLSLVSKFFLVVFVARFLSVAELGVYGIFTVTVSYSLYVIGLDYYTYATREMMSHPEDEWPRLIRDQGVFIFVVYGIGLVILLVASSVGLFRMPSMHWLFLILLSEHLNQEVFRILVALGRPLVANLVFFIRSGAWVYVALLLMVNEPGTRTLETIWLCWFIGGIASLFISGLVIAGLGWSGIRGKKIDWNWILRGVRLALPFFIATLALRGIFTFDRYMIKYFWTESEVGIYTFYMGIAGVLSSFVDAGITVNYYPKMVRFYRSGEYEEYRREKHRMAQAIVATSVVCVFLIALLVHPLLRYIGKEVYRENLHVLWLLLGGMSFMNLSMVPHYGLYSKGVDKGILFSTIVTFCLCVILYSLLIPCLGVSGAAIAFTLAAGIMFSLKTFIYQKTTNTISVAVP